MGLGIFRNFFGQSELNFWDYFRTIRVEFAGLFWDSQDGIFINVFGQSRTVLRFGFYPRCHAPIPGSTQLADPNRVRGARLRTRTLYLIFFFFF